MSEIPKGSILQDVSPYAVVPPFIGADPTVVPGLEGLPKWKDCRIWNQMHAKKIIETPEIQKFLRRARRMASPSSGNVDDSWKILCILTILRVIADNAHEETEKTRTTSPWWSALASKDYDDEAERKMIPNDDDDVDGSLLVELWPLIREHIPWSACQRLYHRIQNRMHVLTIPHPLKSWAQKTIFELSDDEFETSWNIFHSEHSMGTRSETLETCSSPPSRLRASKLWLDKVINIPERLVGVLIEDPMNISGHSKSSCDIVLTKKENDSEISTALTLPRRYQSHLPNTCLELYVTESTKIHCKWMALYDLSITESDNKNRTLSTMPGSSGGEFFDANGNVKTPSPNITAANLAQARRLAHSHFFKEDFEKAMSLYQECYTTCACSDPKAQAEADLWHTMGAVILSQQKFANAQEHWKNGSLYQSLHKEISEQLEKQKAYQYFDPLPHKTVEPFDQQILRNPTSPKSQSIFVASNVIAVETCRKLIGWAQEFALSNGGWTASRHYAVPTNDLPIHKVPKLLEWFQEWIPNVLFPLLQAQFGSDHSADKRFYVHDAFLVRYEATASSNFLPLHYDESTHSCVLALNDDFEGGGSYIYDLDRSIAPETGGMVSFLGNHCLHGGDPVTRGERYILAIFLFHDRDLASSGEGSKGTKRIEEVISTSSVLAKRPKQDKDESQSNQGGGFSFSFF